MPPGLQTPPDAVRQRVVWGVSAEGRVAALGRLRALLPRVWLGVGLGARLLLAPAWAGAQEVGPQPICGPVSVLSAAAGAQVCTLDLGRGLSQRLLVLGPARPQAVLVMFPGGSGRLGLSVDGHVAHGANILVRTRRLWLQRGFAVIIPDAPGTASLRGRRSSALFGQQVQQLLAFARARFAAPLFAVGTSQGTIAAVQAARVAGPGGVTGVVLLESLSVRGGSGETVFDAQPEEVEAPVLVVANEADACPVTPPADAARVASAFTRAPAVTLARLTVGEDGLQMEPAPARTTGGLAPAVAALPPADGEERRRRAAACASLSPHGYRGHEAELVRGVADWIDAVVRAPPR